MNAYYDDGYNAILENSFVDARGWLRTLSVKNDLFPN